MATELSYLVMTPYTLNKSRTGGIIARLLSRSGLELVGARVLAPTAAFADAYAELLQRQCVKEYPELARHLAEYVRERFPPREGKYRRALLLLFRGENACAKLHEVTGPLVPGSMAGMTIRDTYADLIYDEDGKPLFFEPAALIARTPEAAREHLKLLADFCDSQPNVVGEPLQTGEDTSERTLVILKPDNWGLSSPRPGNVIDMMGRSGLRIVGCKIYHMSVTEALEFYGPVKDALRGKLAGKIGKQARELLEKQFNVSLGLADEEALTKIAGVSFADDQFAQIVKFMSGVKPSLCPKEDWDKPGSATTLALIYQGKDSINRIRDVLGPTDPSKAPEGTIRREFGSNVMVNTAHASDSQESAQREMRIIKIENNDLSSIVRQYLNA